MFIRPDNKLENFKSNDLVTYIPSHLIEDFEKTGYRTPGLESGRVKSKNDCFIFVNYIRNDIIQATAEATDPRDLINNEIE
ncbi:MAG: hypothetical protein WC554_10930 [Clostridia bacterium]